MSPTNSETIMRSSLEEMLESIKRRGEEEKPKDSPPALPARPRRPKARPPSAKRPLPDKFKIEDDQNNVATSSKKNANANAKVKEEIDKRESLRHLRKGSFASKKMKIDIESPYIVTPEENVSQMLLEDSVSASPASILAAGKVQELDGEDDNVSYYIRKVTWSVNMLS